MECGEPRPAPAQAATIKCPKCQKEWPAGTKFCGECGTKKPEGKVCPNCGTAVSEGTKFCGECGTKL
jgi:RNA polymerase subunit RPABC4/transcription elongation factor Spt4